MNRDIPQLIALCGFMGCGKTTLGRMLAARLSFHFADTDDLLLAQTGMTLPQMFAAGGEAFFRDREHETVAAAASLRRTVLATGGGVMTFERNARLLSEHALIIYVARDFDACYEAVSARENRPLAGRKSREALLALYEARQAAYARWADFTVHNNGAPKTAVDEMADFILAQNRANDHA